jgi:hypothetical protein
LNTPHNDIGQEQKDAHTLSNTSLYLRTLLPPTRETSSDQTLQTLSGWIEACAANHDSCQRFQSHELPKRVLEIGLTCIYLREHLTIRAKYACLSHCWGSDGPALKLTRTSLHQLESGLLIEHLPKTFREAVLLCSRLSLKFIWIDALCKILSGKSSSGSHLIYVPRYQTR